jgi:Na+/citrate or Na+/malate symporter
VDRKKNQFLSCTSDLAVMRWDRHSLMAFAGIAARAIGGALLLEDAGAVFVPVQRSINSSGE